MTDSPARPAMTMRQIREGLGYIQPGAPDVIVTITRYEVSVFPVGDVNHRYFTLFVELTPHGWIISDGHSGYDADGTAHPGELWRHHFADFDDALAVARRIAPDLIVNSQTATEAYRRTHA